MNLTRTTFFVIPLVIIIPWLFLATPGSQASATPLHEKSRSDARRPVENAIIVNHTQNSHPQDIVLELLDPQGLPVETTSIDLNVIIKSQETTQNQSETSWVTCWTHVTQDIYDILSQGHIAIPSEAVSKYARYKDTTMHVSITEKERKLGSYQSIPWPQKLPSQTITMQFNPLCRIHGTINSSDLSKLGYPLEAISVYSSKDSFYSSYHSKTSDFELLLPPGNQGLRFSSHSKIAKTEAIKQTLYIEPGQREMDLGAIDLPADHLASQFGQPAPELESIQTWINGSPVQLADLRNKIVLLHFGHDINGMSR